MRELLLGLLPLATICVDDAHRRNGDLVGVHRVHGHLRFAAPAGSGPGEEVLFGDDLLIRSPVRFEHCYLRMRVHRERKTQTGEHHTRDLLHRAETFTSALNRCGANSAR